MSRITEVDALRGIGILLMVVYHFFYDLEYFGIADINLYGLGWTLFQRLIAVIFLSVVGISLTLSESRNREGYARHAKRALKLGAVALLITAATWVYPHEGFIMFGIIHFIALATLIGPFFFRFKAWNVVLGFLIIIAGFYTSTVFTDSEYLFWLGIIYPGYHALDHYPLLPWFGVVLLGIYAGQRLFTEGKTRVSGMDKLAFLGRNSLLIYLIHQPIMVGALLAYKILI
jgi:uncharacterized membrane protein